MAPPANRALIPASMGALRPAGAYTFDELYRLAQVCQASGLFEDVADAAQAFVKILKGQELGLPPTTAMAGFDLIRKRLFIKPWVIAAKINACGYGAYRVVEETTERCVILFRKRYPEEGWLTLPEVTYTYVEAKAHGLVERSPHWKASPAHMLYQRCMGRGGLMHFPELLAGVEVVPDEAPVPEARHRQNIIDLFGEGAGADATAPQSLAPRSVAVPVVPMMDGAPPAGEAAAPYIAQIEAAIVAQQAQLAPWYKWAENRYKKVSAAFTVEEWEGFLQAVRQSAAQKRQESPQEAHQGTTTLEDDRADRDAADARAGDPDATQTDAGTGPSWGPGDPDLWKQEDHVDETEPF